MQTQSSEREFHILLWGVTGWTGVHLAEYFCKNYRPDTSNVEHNIRWAMVARNQKKLTEVLDLIKSEFKDSEWINHVPTFIVDNNDEAGIASLVSRTMSVATVVGPYALYGENLLKACVQQGTHYCDITGESTWVRTMIEKYNEEAASKGVFVINGCGCDSVPSDLGAYSSIEYVNNILKTKHNVSEEHLSELIKNNLVKYEIKAYVTKMVSNNRDVNHSGGGGTIASLMNGIQNRSLKGASRHDLLTSVGNVEDECVNDAQHTPQMWAGTDEDLGVKKYTTHWAMATINEKVVRRSRFLMSEKYGNNFSYHEAFASSSRYGSITTSLAYLTGYTLLSFGPTRHILSKFLPKPSQLPPKIPENYKPGVFELTMITTCVCGDIKTKVKTVFKSADEVAWADTSVMLAECCLSLILQKKGERLADLIKTETGVEGGVVTPACLGSILRERIAERGITITSEVIV